VIKSLLEAGESVTKKALAERFYNVDVKTIKRDLASADLRKIRSQGSQLATFFAGTFWPEFPALDCQQDRLASVSTMVIC
jgi:hypothetical protein